MDRNEAGLSGGPIAPVYDANTGSGEQLIFHDLFTPRRHHERGQLAGQGPIKPRATGPLPRCSTGSRKSRTWGKSLTWLGAGPPSNQSYQFLQSLAFGRFTQPLPSNSAASTGGNGPSAGQTVAKKRVTYAVTLTNVRPTACLSTLQTRFLCHVEHPGQSLVGRMINDN